MMEIFVYDRTGRIRFTYEQYPGGEWAYSIGEVDGTGFYIPGGRQWPVVVFPDKETCRDEMFIHAKEMEAA